MIENLKISIIVPNYNCANFIGQTIESVQRQTYKNWELLIADDKSTDNSVEVIKRYVEQDNRIKLFMNSERPPTARGAASARNCALRYATGDYIAFLDSDDLWYPDKLEEQLKFMIDNKLDFTYTWYDVIDEKNKIVDSWTPSFASTTYNEHLRRPVIGCLTVMYRVSAFRDLKFPVPMNDYFYEDSSYWLMMLRQTPKAICLPKKLSQYRLRSKSTSSNKIRALAFFWRTLSREKISIPGRLYSYVYYIFFSLFYKYRQMLNRTSN